MRTLCQAYDTPLFLSTSSDVLVGDQRAGQPKNARVCGAEGKGACFVVGWCYGRGVVRVTTTW